MKGKLLRIIMLDEIFILEFFHLLRIGTAWYNDVTGKSFALILGIWKFETNLTFSKKKKIEWHEVGET